MIIDITKLRSGVLESLPIDFNYSFKTDELKNTDIISLDDVNIKGNISYNYGRYYISIDIKGEFILPCSLTLEPVSVPLNTHVEGDLEKILQEIGQNLTNTLDIFPIIWENILMEVPLKVVSGKKATKTSGDGWKLITEEEKRVNPELEKLKELL